MVKYRIEEWEDLSVDKNKYYLVMERYLFFFWDDIKCFLTREEAENYISHLLTNKHK